MSNLSPSVLQLLNKQIDIELGNSVLYRQLSGVANNLGYLGAESWLKKQSEDELIHYNKFFEYIIDRNYIPEITQIREPSRNFDSLEAMFSAALVREKETTAELKKIRQTAINNDDQMTEVFMNWFLEEQIEEESILFDILAKLKVAGVDRSALLFVDEYLGER